MIDGNTYARRFGRIERQHGNAYAVSWGIGYCAQANGGTYRNPYVIGCQSHVAFNHGQDDASDDAGLNRSAAA